MSPRAATASPSTGGAMECPLDYVIGYCKMLALAGIEPLYRESEPHQLGPETLL